jgi:hypothetical protein
LRQAEGHLRMFEAECNRHLAAANVGFGYDVDLEAGSISVILRADSEPPMVLGAIVGDVLHNLRSALDSIAWETCRRAGVLPKEERRVYFPVGDDPAEWTTLAERKLPRVSPHHLQVFRELQPWHDDEVANSLGVDVDPAAVSRHPLYRLHEMARHDRHRVPHPILARAGPTWLGAPEGVKAALIRENPAPWIPGDVILKWRIDPPSRVSDVHPEGRSILAFDDDAALRGQSALDELQQMAGAVTQALRRVEIEVLEVVTQDQIAELNQLQSDVSAADQALQGLLGSTDVVDSDYIDRYSELTEEVEAARLHFASRWRELFE